MKISKKAQLCELSPLRKFAPFVRDAEIAGKKIYKVNIGQPDIPTPPEFFEAVHRFRQEVLAYDSSRGSDELINAIRGYYRRIGTSYKKEDILITAGGSEALQILFTCILDPGSEVIVPEPFYSNYYTFIVAAGGVIRPLPTCAEEDFNYADRARIEKLINSRTRAILITNPQNPSGNVLTERELRLLADTAQAHDLYLICDEVYREFVYDSDNVLCAGKLRDVDENVVIIDSVSKRFSACGARVGMLISRNRELMTQALKFCQSRICITTLDQIGAAALYNMGPEYFEAIRDEYRRRRDLCFEKLSAIPGVICSKPKGAFYIMATLPVDNADVFQQWLLTDFEEQGETVMICPAASFYADQEKGLRQVRIAYVLKEDELARAMDLLALAIERYNKR